LFARWKGGFDQGTRREFRDYASGGHDSEGSAVFSFLDGDFFLDSQFRATEWLKDDSAFGKIKGGVGLFSHGGGAAVEGKSLVAVASVTITKGGERAWSGARHVTSIGRKGGKQLQKLHWTGN